MTKVCTKCKKRKPTTTDYFMKISRNQDGLDSWCKICRREYRNGYFRSERGKKAQRKYEKSKRGREVLRKAVLKYRYGITVEKYNEMFENQKGCCSICGRHQSNLERRLFVDHNHQTNEVRELLCDNCNKGLGHLKEDITILRNTIKYLNKHTKTKIGT